MSKKWSYFKLHSPLDFDIEANMWIQVLQSPLQRREWLMIIEIVVGELGHTAILFDMVNFEFLQLS